MWIAWFPVLAYAVLIFTLSSMPSLAPPEGPTSLDKAAHFIEYAVLGGLLVRAWGRSGFRDRGVLRVGLTIGCGAAMALLDETLQGLVGRDRSAADWLTDVLALVFVSTLDLWDRRRGRERKASS